MIFNRNKRSCVFGIIKIASGVCVFLGIYVFYKETWNENKIYNTADNQLIFENQYSDSNNIGSENIDTTSSRSVETKTENNASINGNVLYINSIISNKTTNTKMKLINSITKFDNLSFADNKLWFHQKATKAEELPISEYTNKTTRILFWNKDFAKGLL